MLGLIRRVIKAFRLIEPGLFKLMKIYLRKVTDS